MSKGKRDKSDFTVEQPLTPALERDLSIDFEKHSHLTWGEFSKRELRPEYVHGPFFNSCRHKFNNLKKLKKKNSKQYYKTYSEIIGGAYRDPDNSESEDDQFSDPQDENEEFCTPNKPRKPLKSTSGSAKKSSSRHQNSSQKKRATPQAPSTPLSFSSPAKMPSSTTSGKTGASGMTNDEFETLQQAMDECWQVVMVDFAYPEDNGPPLFTVEKLLQIKSPSGRETTSQVKVHLNSLVDLRDYKATKGKVVLGGAGFLVTMPKIPFYRRDKKDVETAHSKEMDPCANTQNSWTTFAHKISRKENADRLLMKVLFVFPNEMLVSADLDSKEAPTKDQKSKLFMREVPCDFTAGGKRYQPTQNPGFWLLQ